MQVFFVFSISTLVYFEFRFMMCERIYGIGFMIFLFKFAQVRDGEAGNWSTNPSSYSYTPPPPSRVSYRFRINENILRVWCGAFQRSDMA